MTHPLIRFAAITATAAGVALTASTADASELGVIQAPAADCEAVSMTSAGLAISSICTQAGGDLQWTWTDAGPDSSFTVFLMTQDANGGWALAPQQQASAPATSTAAEVGGTYALFVVGDDTGLTSDASTVVHYEAAPLPQEEPPPVEEEAPPVEEEAPPVEEEEVPPVEEEEPPVEDVPVIVEEEEPPPVESEEPPVDEEEPAPVEEEAPPAEEEAPVVVEEEEEPPAEDEEPAAEAPEPITPTVQDQPFEGTPPSPEQAVIQRLMDLVGELEDDLEDRDETIAKLTAIIADLENELNRR